MRTAGAVACLGALGSVAACDPGAVPIEPGSPTAITTGERESCTGLVDAVPNAVSDQLRRPVEPEGALGAAWGDPAIVLRCAVPAAAGFDRFATCQETNGVGWFIPEEAIDDQATDVVMTTIGRELNVEVTVPAEHRPPAATMVDLAEAIKETVPEVDPCV